ncbi:hypothetical protein U1Q18_019431, partial [Sarracenia purpurea var. burkii]
MSSSIASTVTTFDQFTDLTNETRRRHHHSRGFTRELEGGVDGGAQGREQSAAMSVHQLFTGDKNEARRRGKVVATVVVKTEREREGRWCGGE